MSDLTNNLKYAVSHNLITESILVQDPGYVVLWLGLDSGQTVPADINKIIVTQNDVIQSLSGRAQVLRMWTEGEKGIPIKDNQTLNLTLKNSGLGAFYHD